MSLGCVVVGVDGGAPSTRATTFAAEMLMGTPGRLVVTAAFTVRPELPESDNAEFRRQATAHATAAADIASAAGVPSSVVVDEGDPISVLERVARAEAADLIVIGTRGRGAVARVLLGSTASYLVAHSATPVAVVH